MTNDLGTQEIRQTPDNVLIIANPTREGLDPTGTGSQSGEFAGPYLLAGFPTEDSNSYQSCDLYDWATNSLIEVQLCKRDDDFTTFIVTSRILRARSEPFLLLTDSPPQLPSPQGISGLGLGSGEQDYETFLWQPLSTKYVLASDPTVEVSPLCLIPAVAVTGAKVGVMDVSHGGFIDPNTSPSLTLAAGNKLTSWRFNVMTDFIIAFRDKGGDSGQVTTANYRRVLFSSHIGNASVGLSGEGFNLGGGNLFCYSINSNNAGETVSLVPNLLTTQTPDWTNPTTGQLEPTTSFRRIAWAINRDVMTVGNLVGFTQNSGQQYTSVSTQFVGGAVINSAVPITHWMNTRPLLILVAAITADPATPGILRAWSSINGNDRLLDTLTSYQTSNSTTPASPVTSFYSFTVGVVNPTITFNSDWTGKRAVVACFGGHPDLAPNAILNLFDDDLGGGGGTVPTPFEKCNCAITYNDRRGLLLFYEEGYETVSLLTERAIDFRNDISAVTWGDSGVTFAPALAGSSETLVICWRKSDPRQVQMVAQEITQTAQVQQISAPIEASLTIIYPHERPDPIFVGERAKIPRYITSWGTDKYRTFLSTETDTNYYGYNEGQRNLAVGPSFRLTAVPGDNLAIINDVFQVSQGSLGSKATLFHFAKAPGYYSLSSRFWFYRNLGGLESFSAGGAPLRVPYPHELEEKPSFIIVKTVIAEPIAYSQGGNGNTLQYSTSESTNPGYNQVAVWHKDFANMLQVSNDSFSFYAYGDIGGSGGAGSGIGAFSSAQNAEYYGYKGSDGVLCEGYGCSVVFFASIEDYLSGTPSIGSNLYEYSPNDYSSGAIQVNAVQDYFDYTLYDPNTGAVVFYPYFTCTRHRMYRVNSGTRDNLISGSYNNQNSFGISPGYTADAYYECAVYYYPDQSFFDNSDPQYYGQVTLTEQLFDIATNQSVHDAVTDPSIGYPDLRLYDPNTGDLVPGAEPYFESYDFYPAVIVGDEYYGVWGDVERTPLYLDIGDITSTTVEVIASARNEIPEMHAWCDGAGLSYTGVLTLGDFDQGTYEYSNIPSVSIGFKPGLIMGMFVPNMTEYPSLFGNNSTQLDFTNTTARFFTCRVIEPAPGDSPSSYSKILFTTPGHGEDLTRDFTLDSGFAIVAPEGANSISIEKNPYAGYTAGTGGLNSEQADYSGAGFFFIAFSVQSSETVTPPGCPLPGTELLVERKWRGHKVTTLEQTVPPQPITTVDGSKTLPLVVGSTNQFGAIDVDSLQMGPSEFTNAMTQFQAPGYEIAPGRVTVGGFNFVPEISQLYKQQEPFSLPQNAVLPTSRVVSGKGFSIVAVEEPDQYRSHVWGSAEDGEKERLKETRICEFPGGNPKVLILNWTNPGSVAELLSSDSSRILWTTRVSRPTSLVGPDTGSSLEQTQSVPWFVRLSGHLPAQIELTEVPQYYTQPLALVAVSSTRFIYAHVRYPRFENFIPSDGLTFNDIGSIALQMGTLSDSGELTFDPTALVLPNTETYLKDSYWGFVAELFLADQGRPIFIYNKHTATDGGRLKSVLLNLSGNDLTVVNIATGQRVFKDAAFWTQSLRAEGLKITMDQTGRKVKIFSIKSTANAEEIYIAVPSVESVPNVLINNATQLVNMQLRDGIALHKLSLYGAGRDYQILSSLVQKIPGFIFDFDIEKTAQDRAVALYTRERFFSPTSEDLFVRNNYSLTREGSSGSQAAASVDQVGPCMVLLTLTAQGLIEQSAEVILPGTLMTQAGGFITPSTLLNQSRMFLRDGWAVFFNTGAPLKVTAFAYTATPTLQWATSAPAVRDYESSSAARVEVKAPRPETQIVWKGSTLSVDFSLYAHRLETGRLKSYTVSPGPLFDSAFASPVLVSLDQSEYLPLKSGRIVGIGQTATPGVLYWWDPLTNLIIDSSAYWARKNLYKGTLLAETPVFLGIGMGNQRLFCSIEPE